ncbi:MAG: hypothetical protein ABMA64_06010 [Myxococcota bacterium]
MSYDAGLWLLLDGVTVVVVTGLLLVGRARAAVVAAALVALVYLVKVAPTVVQPTYSGYWGCSATWPEATGLLREHVLAECADGRAAYAVSVLPFAVPALVLCAVAAWFARPARAVWVAPWVAAIPSLTLVAAALPATVGWSVDDPRWSLGYVQEWLVSGGEGGGFCLDFLQDEAELAGRAPEGEIARAHEACAELCRASARAGRYNPGALERPCAERVQ